MTDLITKARKEWCEFSQRVPAPPGLGLERYYGHLSGPTHCPPEVVAALLDVVESLRRHDLPIHDAIRLAILAEAAITRALEGK
jgi:hypothetical protein